MSPRGSLGRRRGVRACSSTKRNRYREIAAFSCFFLGIPRKMGKRFVRRAAPGEGMFRAARGWNEEDCLRPEPETASAARRVGRLGRGRRAVASARPRSFRAQGLGISSISRPKLAPFFHRLGPFGRWRRFPGIASPRRGRPCGPFVPGQGGDCFLRGGWVHKRHGNGKEPPCPRGA